MDGTLSEKERGDEKKGRDNEGGAARKKERSKSLKGIEAIKEEKTRERRWKSRQRRREELLSLRVRKVGK